MQQEKKKAIPKVANLLTIWAKQVKLRDGYKCQICGYDKDKRFIHAHHKIPKSERQELMLDLDNGISLCLYCHALKHSGFISFVFKKPMNVTTKELMAFLAWQLENNKRAKKYNKEKSEMSKPTKKPTKKMPMKPKSGGC